MNSAHIKSILLQEFYYTRKSMEVLIDTFFFSTINIIMFGLIARYIIVGGVAIADALFVGVIFWEAIRVTQYSMTFGALWNIWSRNLSNMFTTPLTIVDYFLAQIIAGTAKALLVFILTSGIAFLFFNFNIFKLGIMNVALSYINVLFFAFTMGILVMGCIFRFGTKISALAWSLIFIFQPLTAAFFPVRVLPPILQKISYLFPVTYTFEAARASMHSPNYIDWKSFLISLSLNIVYCVIAVWIFNKLFTTSKITGQFARNEG